MTTVCQRSVKPLSLAVFLLGAFWNVQPSYAQDKDIENLVQGLGKSDWDSQVEERLVALGKKALPALCRALVSDNEDLCANAAYILGKIGDPSVISSLKEIARRRDRSGMVAACAIGEIGGPEAVRALAQIGSFEALRALGKIGGPEAATAIIQSLPQQKDGFFQSELILSLGDIGDNRAIEPLIKLLQKGSESRWAVVSALGHFRDPRVRVALKKAIAEDPDWGVYRIAKRALHKMDGFIDSSSADWIATAVVREPEPPEGAEEHVRRLNEDYLKYMTEMEARAKSRGEKPMLPPGGGPPSVYHFISKVEQERARKKVLEDAARTSPPDEIVEDLMGYLVNTKINTSIVRRAQQLIIQIGVPAVPFLINGLKRGDEVLQEHCAVCLGEIGDPAALPTLTEYAKKKTAISAQKRYAAYIAKMKAKQRTNNETTKGDADAP